MISGPMPSPGRTATLILEVPGMLRFSPRLELADLVRVAQREADLVEPVQQAVLAERIDVEVHAERLIGRRYGLLLEVDHQAEARECIALVEQAIDLALGEDDRQKAVLERVDEEDVGGRRRNYTAKAVIDERPGRMLARGAAAEILPGEQDRRVAISRLVQHELRVLLPPVGEEALAEAGLLDGREVLLGNDLVRVDIRSIERRHQSIEHGELFHQDHRRISTKCPAIAAAAAITGLTRCVRPPTPCRPSKLRFEVDAQRSPGSRRSGFMPRHIEQPGSRHSKPASRNTRSRPSFSACSFTRPEPGTTMASFTLDATRFPFTTVAAARRSSMRELVQEPMNTLSMRMLVIGMRGVRPMYSSARSMPSRRRLSFSLSGSGTMSSTATTISGEVPQVTCGLMSRASRVTSRSNFASGSLFSVRQ